MEVDSGNPHFMAFNSNSSLKWPRVEMRRREDGADDCDVKRRRTSTVNG